MPTLAAVLRHEVRRVARKEGRKTARTLRRLQRQVQLLKRLTHGQRRTLASVEQSFMRLKSRVGYRRSGPRGRGSTISPDAIRSLRSRLQMTRQQFAKLVAVSPGSIFGWETGRSSPRRASVARIRQMKNQGLRALRHLVAPRKRRGRQVRRRRRARSSSVR